MATVSVHIPDELERRMDAHDEIDWEELIRTHIRDVLSDRESHERAVAVSDRLRREIDPEAVDGAPATETIRECRDRRHSN